MNNYIIGFGIQVKDRQAPGRMAAFHPLPTSIIKTQELCTKIRALNGLGFFGAELWCKINP
jgi:hypothetical protein